MGCSIRDRILLHGEPHGDALTASMLTSISSLDQFGGAKILAGQRKNNHRKNKVTTKQKDACLKHRKHNHQLRDKKHLTN
ncbi:hypothetical protein YC2023_109449 [Brassica napus]